MGVAMHGKLEAIVGLGDAIGHELLVLHGKAGLLKMVLVAKQPRVEVERRAKATLAQHVRDAQVLDRAVIERKRAALAHAAHPERPVLAKPQHKRSIR